MKIIIFKGGLGNQLFQLSLYLKLVNQNPRCKLFLDNKTGFLLDFKHKRNFELNKVIPKEVFNSNLNYLLNIFLILSSRYFSLNKIFKIFGIQIINDSEFNFFETMNSKKENRKYLLFNGYFQNFKIVENNISDLVKYIEPYLSKKVDNKFEDLYKEILSKENSVALCIRFYEESNDPLIHSLNRKEIKVSEFNRVIRNIEKKLINPHFFIFIQKQNKFIEELNINSKSTLVSHDNGYKGSWERLRAQSFCKHHIFNNSTFYFWGAILSEYRNKNKNIDQIIYCSNNFSNQEIYNPEWKIF